MPLPALPDEREQLSPRITEGPDRFYSSVRCRQFHDLKDQDLDGNYNCCCCDQCNYLRPNDSIRLFPDWNWCCRCVPRVIFAKFIPDDPNDECCRYGGVPLFFDHDFAEGLESYNGSYIGSLYGITIRVDIGTDSSYTGTGTSRDCRWRIRAWNPSLIYDNTVEIDHDTTTCLEVPTVTIASGIEGPAECIGSIVLDDVPKAKLPFVEIEDPIIFNSHRDPREDSSCQGDYTGTGTGTGPYEYGRAPAECQPMFIDLNWNPYTGTGTKDYSCGDCTQVCSRICVTGPRHLGDNINIPHLATFAWFEVWNDEYEVLARRGWRYYNEALERYEYVYLCDYILVDGEPFERDFETHAFGISDFPYWMGTIDAADAYIYYDGSNWILMIGGNPEATGPSDPSSPYGDYVDSHVPPTTYVVSEAENNCYLKFRFEEDEDDDLYDTTAINTLLDGGCSCSLQMLVSDNIQDPENPRAIYVRCGYCSCWKFFCGTCRCVPAELCVIYSINDYLVEDAIFTWDADQYAWVRETYTGTGSEPKLTKISLEDRNGACTLVPDIEGYEIPGSSQLPTWSCSAESLTRRFDTGSDLLSFIYTDYTDGNVVFVVGSSLVLDCHSGDCQEATPCYVECGSHPRIIYMTLTQYRVPGDQSIEDDPGESWDITIAMHYWQTVDYYTPGDPIESSEVKYSCGYVGFIPTQEACCAVRVDVRNGVITFTSISTGCTAITDPGQVPLSESCDPYYADSGEVGPTVQIFPGSCIGFVLGDPTRYRIEITE